MPNDVRDFISNLAEKKMIGGISWLICLKK
jgi:hypothetical protein